MLDLVIIKIIIADDQGIVRSIFIIKKMDYKMIMNVLKVVQKERKLKNVNPISLQKTDDRGFYPTNLFIQKDYLN